MALSFGWVPYFSVWIFMSLLKIICVIPTASVNPNTAKQIDEGVNRWTPLGLTFYDQCTLKEIDEEHTFVTFTGECHHQTRWFEFMARWKANFATAYPTMDFFIFVTSNLNGPFPTFTTTTHSKGIEPAVKTFVLSKYWEGVISDAEEALRLVNLEAESEQHESL